MKQNKRSHELSMPRKKKIFDTIKSVGLPDLEEKVGKDFIENIMNPLFEKTIQVDCIIQNRDLEYNIDIVQNFKNNTFSLYDIESRQLILTIDKDRQGKYLCKPFKLILLIAYQILEEYNKNFSIEDENEYKASIYDDMMAFNSGELEDVDTLSPYLFSLGIIFIHEFNLDLEQSVVCDFSKDSIYIDGMKIEFINKKEIIEEEVVYLIEIFSNKKNIDVEKIFENNKKKKHKIDLHTFFKQYEFDLPVSN